MPLSKDFNLQEFLGINPEEYKDDDDFKEKFGKAWVKSDVAHLDKTIQGRVVGKTYNALRTKFKSFAKAHGLDIEPKAIDEMDPEELVEAVNEATKGRYTKEIGELNEKLKAKPAGSEELEKVKGELEKKIEAHKASAQTWQEKHDKLLADQQEREAKAWEDAQWDAGYTGIKWKQGISEFEKAGFNAAMRKLYRIQKDEQGQPYTTDMNGARIAHPNKASTFLSLGELMQGEAKKHKLDEVNVHGNAPVKTPLTATVTAPPNQSAAPRQRPVSMPPNINPGNGSMMPAA